MSDFEDLILLNFKHSYIVDTYFHEGLFAIRYNLGWGDCASIDVGIFFQCSSMHQWHVLGHTCVYVEGKRRWPIGMTIGRNGTIGKQNSGEW